MGEMHIHFGQDLVLTFDIENHEIAKLWLEKMQQRHAWPLDDPQRFYGFNSNQEDRENAERILRDCVTTINSYQPIIEREFTSIDDQDLLNYLHSIFERYHGLLDQQHTEWWMSAPQEVQKALAILNISIHRVETVLRENLPRFVCTWWGMPKESQLSERIMRAHGSTVHEFGGVYLHYVEIGKTLEDLSIDDDRWIGEDAFQPFVRYSADFCVRFYDDIADVAKIDRYFYQQRQWFNARGIQSWQDYRCMPWRYKVASLSSDMDRDTVLARLSKNQRITDIYIT